VEVHNQSSVEESRNPGHRCRTWFLTTRWEAVESPAAWDTIARDYWRPIYWYIRRSGYGEEDASDLTQGFLASLLRRDGFSTLDRAKGRFRSFLIAALQHYLSDMRDWSRAQKRGGGREHLSFDLLLDDERWELRAAAGSDPSRAFDRSWAECTLDVALRRLQAEYAAQGRRERFDVLEQFLPGGDAGESHAAIATHLGVAVGTVKWEVHRLRNRYREIVHEEVGRTVAPQSRIDEEVRHLIEALCV